MQTKLSTLLAMTAMMTLSANAQVTPPPEITDVGPGQSTTTTFDSLGTEGAAEKSTTIAEVVPAAPATSTTITEVIPAPRPTTVTGSTTTTNYAETLPEMNRLDPVVARRHLSVPPQIVTITPEQRTALDRPVIIESWTEPVRRVYNVERNVVIVEEQGESRELPYLTVPVLFVVDTADLLDADSRANLEQTAAVINEIAKTDPEALFDVEGHTSMEGSAEHNMRLSVERSKRIYDELTMRYGVPASALTAHGYGQNFTMYPDGTERERQEDRRVLVVRTR